MARRVGVILALLLWAAAAGADEPGPGLMLEALPPDLPQPAAVYALDPAQANGTALGGLAQAAVDRGAALLLATNSSRTMLAPVVVDALPVLEFRQVSPVSWRIRAHGVRGDFPLLFSENFHPGWKAYLGPMPADRPEPALVERYRMFEHNEDRQAPPAVLRDYLARGWVSDLGDGSAKRREALRFDEAAGCTAPVAEDYVVDFVSVNQSGAIQNDNLPVGSWSEAWGRTPLPESAHATANGFANLWWVTRAEVERAGARRNPDGSLDVEILLEFAPQRTYVLSGAVSAATMLALAAVFLASRLRRTRG